MKYEHKSAIDHNPKAVNRFFGDQNKSSLPLRTQSSVLTHRFENPIESSQLKAFEAAGESMMYACEFPDMVWTLNVFVMGFKIFCLAVSGLQLFLRQYEKLRNE
ncbi:hypothetical protein GQX74_007572 [Glossina fuscipes]|nr:hypothetical protein GQX74_007572 [Glossina fuscipes]